MNNVHADNLQNHQNAATALMPRTDLGSCIRKQNEFALGNICKPAKE